MANENSFFLNEVLGPHIKGILIDIDDTLYSYKKAHEVSICHCQVVFSKKYPSFTELHNFASLYRSKRNVITKRLASHGSCRSRFLAFQLMFEDLNIPQAYKEALYFEQLYWETLIEAAVPAPGAIEFLKAYKNKGVKICAVTDMQAMFQVRKLEKLKMVELIDYIVTSEEIGVEKPDKRMFQSALDKLDLKAEDVCMIGDSQSKDIEGAENFGIVAHKITLY